MRLIDLHPMYEGDLLFLAEKSTEPSLWQVEAAQAARYDNFSDADEALNALHQMQRVRQVFKAGLENDADFRVAYDDFKPNSWANFSSPPVEEALQQNLAARLYNADPKKDDVALLQVANGARRVGEILLEKCCSDRVPVVVEVKDGNFLDLILRHADNVGIKDLAEDYLGLTSTVTTRITARAGTIDDPIVKPDVEKTRLYGALTNPFMKRILSGEVFYTLTVVPTPKTAAMDDMDYTDYIKLFFEMCDQPWPYISKAQEKLIAELDAGKELRFTNDDGTDVAIGIEGFTFCNSGVAKNAPGSEVFSGPKPGTINGTIVSKGRFSPPHNEDAIIENLKMIFKDGRLVSWNADRGMKHFQDAIGIDDGARYVGEIGIGTNPHLRRHVLNGLLVEKIGGSFHIALGHAYTYTTYGGKPVTVNNGNESKIHWDITTMLYGNGGCMYIDGRKVMENGLFLDPAYDVLNRGWAAVPARRRPAYWRKHPTVIAALASGPVRNAPARRVAESARCER